MLDVAPEVVSVYVVSQLAASNASSERYSFFSPSAVAFRVRTKGASGSKGRFRDNPFRSTPSPVRR